MIVKMKEILLFISASTTDDAIYQLGEIGFVDIKNINPPGNESIDWCKGKLAESEKAISILENYQKEDKSTENRKKFNVNDPEKIINTVLRSVDYRQKCETLMRDYQDQRDWYATWGENVNIKDFSYLRTKGIYIKLYKIEKSMLKTLPDDLTIIPFKAKDGMIPIALFTRNESDSLPFKEEKLPTLTKKEAGKLFRRKKRQLSKVDHYLTDVAPNIGLLDAYREDMSEKLSFRNALSGMGSIEERINYLKGFIPETAMEDFKNTAHQNNWGYKISEPTDPSEVPVYIKNPKWISIINPVLKFVGVVPGYKEVDVSIYFLIAFALFFAMLIGDAGYGLLFLLIAFFLRNKIPSQMAVLVYVLSGATIIWGVLSGTYFGVEKIAQIPFFKNLVVENIASFGVDNIQFMMHLSFIIGAIHLTVAHGIRFFQYINSLKAISEVGWISFVWGLFFVVEMLVLGTEMPSWGPWLFGIGFILVAFFSMEDKNLGKSILLSIANLPLSLINGFSDVVSYVRLFAVGMATAVVASSFNNMIIPPGTEMTVMKFIIASVALFLGHGLNIVLALMAVMVHGIRLNMLEFAGHLGIQFSGEEYNPFKLKTKIK